MARKKAKKRESNKVLAPDQVIWREPNGNFRRGNPGGPGRPFVHQERFLRAINEEVQPGAWAKIIKRAVKDAQAGDRHARDWLSKWLLGMPETAVGDERQTIIDILTDGSFVRWIESEGDGRAQAE